MTEEHLYSIALLRVLAAFNQVLAQGFLSLNRNTTQIFEFVLRQRLLPRKNRQSRIAISVVAVDLVERS